MSDTRTGGERAPAPQQDGPDEVLARASVYGVDLSQLRERLRLSPTDRLRKHQGFLKFVIDVREAGRVCRRH